MKPKLVCICFSDAAGGPRIVVHESTNVIDCIPGRKLTTEEVEAYRKAGVDVIFKRR